MSIREKGGGGGGGRAGGGGIPAAFLPQPGITSDDVREHRWRGLLVGLGREDAGVEWKLETVAGTEAVQATVSVSNAAGTSTLTVTIGPPLANGAEGNAWGLSRTVSGGNEIRTDNMIGGQPVVQIWTTGLTFTQVAALINAVNGLSASVAGVGSNTFENPTPGTQVTTNFSGGVDADALGVRMDVPNKTIELEHLVGHTQQELVEFLNNHSIDSDTTLYATLYADSNGSAALSPAPQTRPFGSIYPGGSLPRPTEAELTALSTRLDDLTFSDIGGMIADGQVPGAFTRDAEITRSFLPQHPWPLGPGTERSVRRRDSLWDWRSPRHHGHSGGRLDGHARGPRYGRRRRHGRVCRRRNHRCIVRR